MQYEDILKNIKSKKFDRLYYFYGKDVMSVEKLSKYLISAITDGDESCYQKFIGKELNLSDFADYIEMFPMTAEYNLIVVNDLNAEEMNADYINNLLKILSDIPPFCIVLFYITGFDVAGGKKFPLPKNKKLIDFVSKNGIVCNMELKSVAELTKSVIRMTEKMNCQINRFNAEEIVQLCLCNSSMIKNEVEKLCSYADGNEITGDMISALVPRQLDSTVFNLAKAVTSFNLKKALFLLDEVFLQQNDAVSVLGAITGAFIDFYRAKTALSYGKNENDVIKDFPYKGKEFAVRNAFRDCRKVSDVHLRKCLEILAEADKSIKSFSGNERLIIEQAVVKMAVKDM